MNLAYLQQYNFAEAFGWTLLHSLWQGALVVAILALIYQFAKPKKSETRYTLAVGSLLLIFLGSGLTFWQALENTKKIHVEVDASSLSSLLDEVAQLEMLISKLEKEGPSHEAFWQGILNKIEPYTPWLTWVWLLGFIFFSIKWLMGYLFVQNLRFRHSVPMNFEWQAKLNHLAKRIGLQQTLLMLESQKISSPMVIGHLKPVVLVPMGLLTGMNPNQVEAILAHELAHILRNDFLVNLLLSFIEGIFFYHPAVWWISDRIRQEREHCCDDMAVAITENKKEYAETLALVATHSIHSPKMAMTMQGKQQHLMTRIKRLFQPEFNNNRLSGRAMFGIIVLMGFSTLAWVSPETAKQIQPMEWAQTFDAPITLSEWMFPTEDTESLAWEESKKEEKAFANMTEREFNNVVYNITRLDTPPIFPPMPPLPDFRNMPLPPNAQVPPMPQFPQSLVLQIDEDMTDEEIEELIEEYEEEMEEWGEKYGKSWENFGEAWEEWGEKFGEKMKRQYGKDMERWAEEYGEEYGEMWEDWGEKLAEEIERGMESDDKQSWMRELERELSKLSNDIQIRVETDDDRKEVRKNKGDYEYRYEYNYDYDYNYDNDREDRDARRDEERAREREILRRQQEREARMQEVEARRLEEEARRQEERARVMEERARALEERARERAEVRAEILRERERERAAQAREEERSRGLYSEDDRMEDYRRKMEDYEKKMRWYEEGQVLRENQNLAKTQQQIARDKAMLEREVRALKGQIDRDSDVIFDDNFIEKVESIKGLASEIEQRVAEEQRLKEEEARRQEEIRRQEEFLRRQQEVRRRQEEARRRQELMRQEQERQRQVQEQLRAERERQAQLKREYQQQMREVRARLAEVERAKIQMQREMREKELVEARLKAEKARKAAEAKTLRPVSPSDNVNSKVTKIAEIAKAMKEELVRDRYLSPESRVKISVTNGVIMVNKRALRSEDYSKYRKMIRMMGINLYDGDTVIEF